MKHPILGGLGFVYYGFIWILVIAAHAAVLHYNFSIPLALAFQDSVTFNALFAGFGLGFWYIVRFSIPEQSNMIRPVFSLILTGLFSVGLWLFISTSIMQVSVSSDSHYLLFLRDSQVWRIVSGSLYYAVIVLTYYLIYYNANIQEQATRQLQLANAVKEAELKMLKFQINPHFIFNGLNSISSLTLSNPQKAQQMIIKLSNFLRYSIGQDNKETNRLEDEIKNIILYLDIEKIRFGDRLKFNNHVGKDCQDCTIPNLILQPLFENAIKHGVQESIETITIDLRAQRLANLLQIEISNNFDQEAVSHKGAGIGLENIKQRLALLYGSSELLQYGKEEQLFKVTLEIPQS